MHFCYKVSKVFFQACKFFKFISIFSFSFKKPLLVSIHKLSYFSQLCFHKFFIEINFSFSFLIVIVFSFSVDCSILHKVVTQQRMKNLKQMNVDLVLLLLTLINYLKSIMHKSKHLHAFTRSKISHSTFLSHCAKKWKYKIQVQCNAKRIILIFNKSCA